MVLKLRGYSNSFLRPFLNIFTSNEGGLQEYLFFGMEGCVAEDMNRELLQPFLKEEIKNSLFSMHLRKAPGKYGMPVAFFQRYWHVVGDKISEACLCFLNGGGDLGPCNHTLFALILKTKDP